MTLNILDDAADLVEKANRDLEPALVSAADVRTLLARYARIEKLASYGRTVLAAKIDDPSTVARTTGTSIGRARAAVETAKALRDAPEVSDAFAGGAISLDQATEIAKAEQARPGSAPELLAVAQDESFNVLRDKARMIKLEAEQSRGLGDRQKEARSARSFCDDLGMVNIHLRLQPHVGTPIVNRAEAEGARLYRKAKAEGKIEPFERMLADAYAGILSGKGKGRTTRPELVVVVSHEVTQRGWTDVKDGEMCKIPGVGPVAPEVARKMASDAFLSGVFFDGKDLRNFCRWTRNIPVEVRIAPRARRAPGFRRGQMCRLRQSLPKRKRSRRTPQLWRVDLDRQHRTPVLAVPPSQNRARPQGGQADTGASGREPAAVTPPFFETTGMFIGGPWDKIGAKRLRRGRRGPTVRDPLRIP